MQRSCWSTGHDYHTFQPLLYQLATGFLETTAVGHSLRDLLARHTTRRPQGERDGGRPRRAEVASPGARADRLRLSRSSASARRSTSSAREGAAEHAFPMYTLPTLSASRITCSSGGRRRTAIRASSRTARSTSSSSAVARPASRPRGRSPSSTAATSPRTIRRSPAGRGAGDPGRGRAGALSDVQAEAPRVHAPRRSPTARSRSRPAPWSHRSRRRRSTLKSGEELTRAHPDLGRRPAGQRARRIARARAAARKPDWRRARPARSRATPRSSWSATSRRSWTRRPNRSFRSSGRSPSSPASTPARRSPGGSPGRRRSRSSIATRARWRRSAGGAAVVQMLGGRTMTGPEGPDRVGHGAPRAAADERGPCEGGRRLGRGGDDPPTRRSDHGGERVAQCPWTSAAVDLTSPDATDRRSRSQV